MIIKTRLEGNKSKNKSMRYGLKQKSQAYILPGESYENYTRYKRIFAKLSYKIGTWRELEIACQGTNIKLFSMRI